MFIDFDKYIILLKAKVQKMSDLIKNAKSIQLSDFFLYATLTLWMVGIHVTDFSRIIAVIAVFSLLTKKQWVYNEFQLDKNKCRFLCFFICFLLLLLPLYQISKVYSGQHGIDFAIFSQVIDSISRYNSAASSLVAEGWVNFLGHHFVPFLYIPGLLGFLGVPSYLSGPLVHSVGIAIMAVSLFGLARNLGFSKPIGVFFVTLTLANPSIRHTVFWSIHDETFALPFIALAFLLWQLGKHWSCSLALLSISMIKESMFLFNICFCLMVFLVDYKLLIDKKKWIKHFLPYALIIILSITGFIAYFFLQPMLINKNFDHFNKLASIEHLLSFEIIKKKLLWLGFLFVPVLGLPLFKIRSIVCLLPALPFIGIVFVSNFSQMYKLMNYYTAVPSLIVMIASMYALKIRYVNKLHLLPKGLVIAGISLAFSFASSKPSRDFIRNIKLPHRDSSQLSKIPAESIVVATPSAALFLFHCKKILRIFWATRQLAYRVSPNFDYIVTKADEHDSITASFRKEVHLCAENSLWHVYCHDSLPIEKTTSLLAHNKK